jgi:hypothetical protein
MTSKNIVVDFTPQPDFSNVLKIHALETIEDAVMRGGLMDHCNTVFYEDSLEDVIARCQGYLGKPGQTSEGFVIFKAVAVVRVPLKPTEVIVFDESLLQAPIVGDDTNDE